jgi:hypothetical protein
MSTGGGDRKSWVELTRLMNPSSRVLVLICLLAEAAFGVAFFGLNENQRLSAVW